MESTLTRKRWYRIIPIVFITYSLAYLDRANFGFAAAGGMANDLNITTAASSLLASLFFLGYFFFQIPGTIYAANKSTKRLIFWSLIFWGMLASATGIIRNLYLLYVIRFLLGVVESAIWPSMIILLSRWFLKTERSKANAFLTLGNPLTVLWMSILSGYLVSSFSWRGMFILEGLPAVVWAFFWRRFVDDKPKDARWMTQSEKDNFDGLLLKEQKDIKPVKNYAEAFRSPVVILLCFQYAFWSIGMYGFVMWLPSMIKAAPNISIVATGWLAAVPYVFAITGLFTASYFSDKTLNRKEFVWTFLLLASDSFYFSYLVGSGNFWLSFVLLVIAGASIYVPFGPFIALQIEVLPQNVAPGAIALINSFGALGAFLGSYFVGYLEGITKGFGASYVFMAGSLLLSSALTVFAVKSYERKKLKAPGLGNVS